MKKGLLLALISLLLVGLLTSCSDELLESLNTSDTSEVLETPGTADDAAVPGDTAAPPNESETKAPSGGDDNTPPGGDDNTPDILDMSEVSNVVAGKTYTISDKEDLLKFVELCKQANNYFQGSTVLLTEDIVLNEGWIASATAPTGEGSNIWIPITCFLGTFDGQNHSISGLYVLMGKDCSAVKTPSGDKFENVGIRAGLFAILSGNATVKNLTISNSYMTVKQGAGALAGMVSKGVADGAVTIDNVTVNVDVILEGTPDTNTVGVGGLVGKNDKELIIQNCTNNGKLQVNGSKAEGVGGIIGYASAKLTVTDCTNEGDICGKKYVAGILGAEYAYDGQISITSGINRGNITINGEDGGGIVGGGWNWTGTCTLTGCENFGSITKGSRYVGGIIGNSDNAAQTTLKDCINHGEVSSETFAACLGGIIGRTSSCPVTLEGCTNNGNVTGPRMVSGNSDRGRVGGLIGRIPGAGTFVFTNCLNTGTITGDCVGGMIGHTDSDVTMTGCVNKGAVDVLLYTDRYNYAGGFIGQSKGGTFTDCINMGTLTDSDTTLNSGNYFKTHVGGFIGQTESPATFIRCADFGTYELNCVTKSNDKWTGVGGFVGRNNQKITFTDCAYYGEATVGTSDAGADFGGFIGVANGEYTLTNCISAGVGTTKGYLGAFVGRTQGKTNTWTNCFYQGISNAAGNGNTQANPATLVDFTASDIATTLSAFDFGQEDTQWQMVVYENTTVPMLGGISKLVIIPAEL